MQENIKEVLQKVKVGPGLCTQDEIKAALDFYREALEYSDLVSDVQEGGNKIGQPNIIRGQIKTLEWYVDFNNKRGMQ